MTSKIYKINSEQELKELAHKTAPRLKTGDAVLLEGELGAGKTAFARALINSLADQALEVPSPTFTLVQTYDLPNISIWHFDLYRLEEKAADVIELGWDEARRYGVSIVEWPQRLGSLCPKDRLEIHISFSADSNTARTVELKTFGNWENRQSPEI